MDSYPFGAPDLAVNDNQPYVLLVLTPGDPAATAYDVERKVLDGPWLPLATLVDPTWDYEDSERVFDGVENTWWRARAHVGGAFGPWFTTEAVPTNAA